MMPEGQPREHGGRGSAEESEAELLPPLRGQGRAGPAAGQGGGREGGKGGGSCPGQGRCPGGRTHHTMP